MGRYVGGKWREDLPDLTGNGGSQSNSDPVSAPAPAPSSGGGGGGNPTPSAPAPSNMINPSTGRSYDFNNQSDRADFRTNTGGFIDDSGVYANGAGQRLGDTWSGANIDKNVAPSPTQLPILNGTPVSPSNGFTGPQTDAIMYRGDPLYSQYFGQGTPGYSSTSKTYNATPGALPQDQATYQVRPLPTPQPSVTTAGTGATTGGVPSPTGLAPTQQAESSADSTTRNNQQMYLLDFQQPNASGVGYGPYATPQPPQLTVHGRYVENGRIIEKSTDQFGHEYFQAVGQSDQGNTGQPAAPAQPAQAPAQTAQPTQPTNPNTGQPATPAQQSGGALRTVMGTDGKPYSVTMSDQDWNEYQQDKTAQAAAEKQAREFDQGIAKDKVDIDRAVATWNQTYQQSLLQFQDRQLAQQTAYQAMQVDLQKQAQELQRQSQAQTISLERDKLDLARRQTKGASRRLPQVRYV